jgi:SAM-dependent methyltransferase
LSAGFDVLRDAVLRLKFRRRGPWVTRFQINGRSYGGRSDFDDEAIREFTAAFQPCRVLELGSLEGGHTIELARRGYSVTAVEGRPENVRRARWVCRLLDLDPVILTANLEETPLREFGRFDVVFCSGLLYHLPRPWECIAQLPTVARGLYLSTHYTDHEETEVYGLSGRWYHELGRHDPLSGLSERSFWPTKTALLDLLRASGYRHILLTRDWMQENGPRLNLVASTTDEGRDAT